MNCFAVYSNGKQLRVYPYEMGYRWHGLALARQLALALADSGSHSVIEEFNQAGIGFLIYDSKN